MVNDLRYAVRVLRKNPGFTFAAIVTLMLGVGANAAIFSIVNTVLLKPLPYAAPERLYVAAEFNRENPDRRFNLSSLDFLDWRARTTTFERMAAYVGTGFTFTGDGEPELALGQMATPELFAVLGVRPLLGRVLTADEAEVGKDRVMVLSYGLWKRRFGADPQVVGRTVTANGKPYTIVGVMPATFMFPSTRYELWVPFALRGNTPQWINRSSHFLRVVGRLKVGVSGDAAAAEIASIARALEQQYPDTNRNVGGAVTSLNETIVGDVRRALLVLLGAVGFVLLIACTNVTNLLLARASMRQHELAIRTALGAGQARIVRQLLTESVLLYIAGSAGGLLLAAWGLALVKDLGPGELPRLDEVVLDGRVFVVVLLVSLVTAIAFGLLPALHSASPEVTTRLKSATRGGTGGRERSRMRAVLVVSEVALSLVLLVGAGLALKSFVRLQSVDTGFDTTRILTFGAPLSESQYPDARRMLAVHRQLLDRLLAEPAFEAVATTTHLPLTGQDLVNSIAIEGQPAPADGEGPAAGIRGISADYFRVLGIPIRRGHPFTDADREGSPPVAIINETLARRYWSGTDPIGKRLKMGSADSASPWHTVVGIVGDVTHRSLEQAPGPEVFFPYGQLETGFLTQWGRGTEVVIRTRSGATDAGSRIRPLVHEVDPNLPIARLQPMSELLTEAVAQPRFRSTLLALFALVALILAAVGIFGVMSYFVTQRTQEIGIRMALGADRRDVLQLVVGRGLMLVALGIATGLACAVLLTRWMQALLFHVRPTEPVTFASVSLLLALVAFLASYLPARRAVSVDPVTALRAE
jgi:putative ABC transport system permease protein